MLYNNTRPGYAYTKDQNYSNYPRNAMNTWTHGGYNTYRRSLMQLEVAILPMGTTVHSATLYFYSDPTQTSPNSADGNSQLSGSNAFFIEKVSEPWNEQTVTWNNQPMSSTTGRIWVGPSSSPTENIQIDLTSMVQSWVDNPSSNYGIKMFLENEVRYRSRNYGSMEHSNTNIHPKLVISYTAPDREYSLDSATLVSLPWYDNNDYLIDFLESEGYGQVTTPPSNPAARITSLGCESTKFLIPITIYAYHRSDGTDGPTDQYINEVLDRVNEIHGDQDTGIKFYIDETLRINSDGYHHGLDNGVEAILMFIRSGGSRTDGINLHIVDEVQFNIAGMGLSNAYPLAGILKNNAYISRNTNIGTITLTEEEAGGLAAHELGHCLGLRHTHDPGRNMIRLLSGDANGDITNGCYQEFVSRTIRNNWFRGCFNTHNKVKAEINGDFLRDTNADPLLSRQWVTATGANTCVFNAAAAPANYRQDLDNPARLFDPPVHNVMSYTRYPCMWEFSLLQTGVMWKYARDIYENVAHTPVINGTNYISAGTSYNYQISDLPQGLDITWMVSENLQINGPNNATTVNISTNSSSCSDDEWVEAWIGGVDCRNPVYIKKLSILCDFTGELTGPEDVCVGNTYRYTFTNTSSAPVIDYNWIEPEGTYIIDIFAEPFEGFIDLEIYYDFGWAELELEVDIGDGTIYYWNMDLYSDSWCGYYGYSVSPNPSSTYLEVALTDTDGTKSSDLSDNSASESTTVVTKVEILEIKLFNDQNKLVKQVTFEGGKVRLDTGSLPEGNYILHVIKNDGIDKRHIVISKNQ